MILWLLQRRRFWQQFQHPFIIVLVLFLFIFQAILICFYVYYTHVSIVTQLFNSDDTLKQVCENVVIPSITLRDSDAEMFEDNPQEYIKRDIEGSDRYTLLLLVYYYCNIVYNNVTFLSFLTSLPLMPHRSNTRRRAATELVKGLRKHYEETVSGIFTAYINLLLQQYAANPAENWRAKDAAMYLVTALSVTTATAKAGANRTNEVRFRVYDNRFRVL